MEIAFLPLKLSISVLSGYVTLNILNEIVGNVVVKNATDRIFIGLVIIGLVVDGLSGATCGSDHLFSHLTFGIVIILDGIDNHLGGYNLAGKFDIGLGSTDDSAFLALIIILSFARNVNRTDDASVAIVDIFIVSDESCSRRCCRTRKSFMT